MVVLASQQTLFYALRLVCKKNVSIALRLGRIQNPSIALRLDHIQNPSIALYQKCCHIIDIGSGRSGDDQSVALF